VSTGQATLQPHRGAKALADSQPVWFAVVTAEHGPRVGDEPRVVVRFDKSWLALSLDRRIDQSFDALGQRGLASTPPDQFDVILDEFPRRPEQLAELLDVIGAWLDEVGQPEVTVEIRWRMRESRKRTGAQQIVLYWKPEDGPDDALSPSSNDVGPAWLETRDEDGAIQSEPFEDGRWLTRMEAFNLASVRGYTIRVDE
jgi:hypothetical protein